MDQRAEQWYARVEGALRSRAVLRRAAVVARAGDPEAARELLVELRTDADSETREQAWLLESGILVETGAAERAIEVLSDALAELPGSVDLLYSRAMAAVTADALSLAEQDLRAIIQNDPENAMALNALGYTLSDRTDRQREAFRLIETALELDPDNPAILDSMGWVLFKLGRPAEALEYVQRAAAAQPHPEIVAHLIEVLWALDRRDEALAWIDRLGPRFEGEPIYDDTLERLGIE
jgi:predicted Zn-dependent protease